MINANLLELEIMAYRYLYYVLAEPVLTDGEYDIKERAAKALLPISSPVHSVVSSLPSSYTVEQINKATELNSN